MSNKNALEFSKYAVAYLDLLGTKANIKSVANSTSIRDLWSLVTKFEETISKIMGRSVDYRIFSDNICIFIKLENDNDNRNAFEDLLRYVSVFQSLAIAEFKLLFRGGIAVGDFFVDDNFIIGQALCDAVWLEEKEAKTPRVILHETAVGYVENHYPIEQLVENGDIFKDEEYYALDYLMSRYNTTRDDGLEFLKEHKEVLTYLLKESKKEALEKVDFLIKYHNKCCKEASLSEFLILNNEGKNYE